jgi:hypothetical protein
MEIPIENIAEQLEIIKCPKKALSFLNTDEDSSVIDIALFSLIIHGYEIDDIPKEKAFFEWGCQSVLWYLNIEDFLCPKKEIIRWILNNADTGVWLYMAAVWNIIGDYGLYCPIYCMDHVRIAIKYGRSLPKITHHMCFSYLGNYTLSECDNPTDCKLCVFDTIPLAAETQKQVFESPYMIKRGFIHSNRLPYKVVNKNNIPSIDEAFILRNREIDESVDFY